MQKVHRYLTTAPQGDGQGIHRHQPCPDNHKPSPFRRSCHFRQAFIQILQSQAPTIYPQPTPASQSTTRHRQAPTPPTPSCSAPTGRRLKSTLPPLLSPPSLPASTTLHLALRPVPPSPFPHHPTSSPTLLHPLTINSSNPVSSNPLAPNSKNLHRFKTNPITLLLPFSCFPLS